MSSQPNPEQPQFAQGLRGYDRDQVDEYVATLTSWVAEWRDRAVAAEAELHQLRDQVAGLRGRLERAEGQAAVTTPENLQAAGERVGRILQAAFEAAEETRADAAAEAEEMLRQARDGAAAQLQEAGRQAEEVVQAAQTDAAGIVSEAAAQRLTAEEAIRTLLTRRATVVADLARLRDDLGVVLDGHHGALTDGAVPEAMLAAAGGSPSAEGAGEADPADGADGSATAPGADGTGVAPGADGSATAPGADGAGVAPGADGAAFASGADGGSGEPAPDDAAARGADGADTVEEDADVTMVLPTRTR